MRIRDAFAALGIDRSGHSTVIAAYLPTYMRLPRRTVSRWSRIASHLSAGFRVHRGLAALASPNERLDPFTGSEADLGLSLGAVSRSLQGGMKKLGLSNGSELAALFSPLIQGPCR
jgi:hypothetical protein